MQNNVVFLAQAVPEGRVFAMDAQALNSIGIQLFNGIILAVALTFILYKPVKEFMRKRAEMIQNKIDDAAAAMAKANGLIAEYDTKINNIDEERLEILEDARIKAADERNIILEEAKQDAAEIKKRSLDSISEEKKLLKDETRLYIVDLASLIAEKYIAKNMDNDAHEKILEDTLAKMEDSQWQS